MDARKTIEFADHICEDAKGNLTKMNRIGANKAFKFYQDNVVMLATVSREQFVASYPQHLEEIEGIRLAAEKSAEAEEEHVNQGDRIAALEVKMDKLADAIGRFMEEAKTDDAEEEDEEDETEEDDPPKRKRRRTKKDDTSTEEESPPADDAEGEDETAEDK